MLCYTVTFVRSVSWMFWLGCQQWRIQDFWKGAGWRVVEGHEGMGCLKFSC